MLAINQNKSCQITECRGQPYYSIKLICTCLSNKFDMLAKKIVSGKVLLHVTLHAAQELKLSFQFGKLNLVV